MTLPASGAISLGAVNTELGLASNTLISLGSTSVRILYGISTGPIRLAADGYGKANSVNPGAGVTDAGPPFYYDFTNTVESFTGQNTTLTATPTYMQINSTGTDPAMRKIINIAGSKYPYVQIRIFRTAGTGWDGLIFYSTAGHAESGFFYKSVGLEPTYGGSFQWITANMHALTLGGTDWATNTITNIRFDLGLTAADDFQIDALVFRGSIYPVAGYAQYSIASYFNENVGAFAAATYNGATNQVNVATGIDATTSYEWRGYFLAPTTGDYTFYTNSDDASYLWLGTNAVSGYTTSNAIVNNGGLHGMVTVTSGKQSLVAGVYYPIRIQYGNNGSAGGIIFGFAGPGILSTTDGTGYYFYNADTTGI
jgi:hypothetical protein